AQFPEVTLINFPLFLEVVLKFTRHPSVGLSQIAQSIWLNILRSPHLSSHELVLNVIPTLLKFEVEKLIRCGYPSKNDCLSSKYSMIEFDSDDEFEVAFYKCRADVAENLRVITKINPKVAFSFGNTLLIALLNGEDWNMILDKPFAKLDSEVRWESMLPYLDAVCGTLTKNPEIPEIKALANDALRLLSVAVDSTCTQHGVQSILLSCVSSLFYFVTFQPEMKTRIYEKIFSYLTCAADSTKDKEAVSLKRHSTSLLIKLSLSYPNLLLPDFDYLCNKVQALLSINDFITRSEKCALLESLMILSNSFCDFERQSNFLKAALSSVEPIWTNPVIIQAIQSPEAFVSFLGIDKPLGNESPINQHAADLMLASNVTRACIKRCTHPSDPDIAQRGNFIHPLSDSTEGRLYRNPAAQHVICVMDKVIQIVKILNVLHDPVVKQIFHSDYSKLMDLTEVDKNCILGSPQNAENSHHTKTSFDRVKVYLQQLNENLLFILGSSAEKLSIDFYNIPGIFDLVKENIFHKIEHIPVLHLKNLIRLFLKPFFIHCPPNAYHELMVVLAAFCPFMLQKLNAVWEKFKFKYGTGIHYEDQMSEIEEILEDQLNRILTKEYIFFIDSLLTQPYNYPIKEDKMESDQKEPTSNGNKTITELGLKIMETERVRVVFICTVFDSLRWLDTSTNNKASFLCGIVFNHIFKERLIRQVQEANYLLHSVLYSLQEFGEHEANLNSLLNLGVNIYEGLRSRFTGIRSALISFVSCTEESIMKLEEVLNKDVPKTKKEKQKKDAFKNVIANIIGKSIGQRHKKSAEIKNLPPFFRIKRRSDSTYPDFYIDEDTIYHNIFI
ncbi:exportin-5, partial [Nephila pilipes]